MSGDKPRLRRKIRLLDREEHKKQKRMIAVTVGKSGMWPLEAPGMPPPGPDFLRKAQDLGDNTVYVKSTKTKQGQFTPGERLQELYRRALREPGFTLDVEVRKGQRETVTFVPGHIWGQYADEWAKSLSDANYEPTPVDGPHPADVFVLGKMPWRDEISEYRILVGASGEVLTDTIARLHIKGAAKWYVTNLCKFSVPDRGSNLPASWVHDCMPLLAQELRIVRPKFILCLGADASTWLLGDKYNVSYMAGRVVPHTFRINLTGDEEPQTHTAQVMTVLHPAEVARSPEKRRILESNMGRFAYLLEGADFSLAEQDLDHRIIDTYEDAVEWCQEVNAYMAGWKKRDRLIGWDAEWQGQHPVNEGSYVRTIQLAWDEKKAVCFKLRHQGGKLAFRDRDGRPAVKRLAALLNDFMADKRAVGHFLVSDLEWLNHMGVYPTAGCAVPLYDLGGTRAWERLRGGEGWLDTAMMCHAIEETAPLGLEWLAMRYTRAPRYDIALEDHIRAYCKEKGLKREALEGYGEVPDKILLPYALYDSDVTLRIAKTLLGLLDNDYEGNCCWEPFWESMIIQKVILKIHQNGVLVDRARIDDLTKKFLTAKAAQEERIVTWAKWPDFNVRSHQQVREFLFGEKLNGKLDDHGENIRIRPAGARSLYVTPLLDTSKPPRRWSDLVARHLDKDATPGTGKLILSILAQENLNVADQINWIRDYRFTDQVLKSVLRHPRTDEEDNWVENEDGFLEYDAGLAASIDCDGRVRTHIYPTAETGRWKHSRPNLANISKSRDDDYYRLLGGKKVEGKWVGSQYTHTLRSIIKATPGYALIEFDYIGAELEGMALMSGSKLMQEHCRRARLPDKGYNAKGEKEKGGKCPHPDYYDIHSNVAVMAFQLHCPPTKDGLESIGKLHFRTLAKNVIFGIAYGRGAKAIALQAKEQGVNVTPEDAQLVIDAIFAMYPELVPFFGSAKGRALTEKWLCHCFGRFRRFPTISDYKMEGEFERQAMNFPIQGMVASAVDRGMAYLDDKIDEYGLQDDIRILLQMHDAGLVEVCYHLIPYAVELIKWAMCDMVEIWPTTLDGQPTGEGPFNFGVDVSVYEHWAEKYSADEAAELGIPAGYAKG
jgi:uracil-DNA glycosylase family 4